MMSQYRTLNMFPQRPDSEEIQNTMYFDLMLKKTCRLTGVVHRVFIFLDMRLKLK